jgi:hypothetical protein
MCVAKSTKANGEDLGGLDEGVFVYVMQLHSLQKRPNL